VLGGYAHPVPGSILGTAVRRVEDPDLLTGRSTFTDNRRTPGALHLAFVRSPFAHARILAIDTSAAAVSPGVVAVLTADDLDLPPFQPAFTLNDACPRPPLATGKVRFAGEPVAVVVAESWPAAVDAVELVDTDFEPLDVVVDPEAALLDSAPLQFEELGTNLVAGARDDGSAPVLGGADVVVRARMENQRLAVAPMEPNVVVVEVDDPDYELVVTMSTQMPHGARSKIAKTLGIDAARIRVVAPHVGGAFGGKAGVPVEHMVAAYVARTRGRTVRWVETRSEAQLSMHGRGQVQYAELGLTTEGIICGLRCRVVGDAGAYAGFGGGLAEWSTHLMAQGVYRVPAIRFDAAVALTNTAPMGAFRGAGRPEAAALLERMMDLAAAELDIDPVEIRRRNLLTADEFPYRTATGATYDVGDYALPLREVLRLADYEALRAEQRVRRDRGDVTQLGIGLGVYVEITGGGSGEFGSVEVDRDGDATIRVGTSAHGQGHATSFSMLVADRLGIDMQRIRFVQSDTAAVPRGQGTGGSRSLQLGGSAVAGAADLVVDQARELAALLLEVAADEVVLSDRGEFHVVGVPTAAVSWQDVLRKADEDGLAVAAELSFPAQGATFPFGAHLAVVEVDTETGQVTPRRHYAVDDCGRLVNPLLVAGQQHGGIAQGISQALWERFEYDPDGMPLTGTFADYSLPSAVEMPPLDVSNTVTPTPLNPLGAKGIGEAATVGATPAVQNAVVDALRHLGVRHVDMPCTPYRVWSAMRAVANGAGEPWREPPDVFSALPVREDDDDVDEATI
jgi:aerobic carbon-monoxide dehydrogenase large subunit